MINKISIHDLYGITEHTEIASVWLIEDDEGGFYLAIDYLSNHGQETVRGILHGHQGGKRVWRKLNTAVEFWRKHVPGYLDINLKLNNAGVTLREGLR